jgi:hypothetical protein
VLLTSLVACSSQLATLLQKEVDGVLNLSIIRPTSGAVGT